MFLRQYQRQRKKCFLSERELKKALRDIRERRGWVLVIFDWFVLSMRIQVILDSSFAHPGSTPIGGGGGRKESSGTGLTPDWRKNWREFLNQSCNVINTKLTTFRHSYENYSISSSFN